MKQEIVKVSVKVRAIDDGYFGSRIIKAGEVFQYTGALNHGRLPQWVEALEKWEAPAKKEPKAPKAPKADKKDSEAAQANDGLPSLT